MGSNQEILTKAIEDRYDLAFRKYIIAPDGTVKNKKSGRVVKGSINRKGYRYIAVYDASTGKQGKVYVHRLVALRYIPNPENKPHINHKDGQPLNNDKNNLEWCTAQENVVDGFSRGREVWNKGNISKERMMYLANKYPKLIFWYLTKDNFAFAKALWGEYEPKPPKYVKKREKFQIPARKMTSLNRTLPAVDEEINLDYIQYDLTPGGWKHHLQQMVIADDPIKYLGEHL